MTYARKRAKKVGFTLPELLTALAIIAVLVGLILPLIGRAEEAGRQAVCASNLRQIGIAYVMYEDDWDGRPPSLLALAERGYVRDNRIFLCPSDPARGLQNEMLAEEPGAVNDPSLPRISYWYPYYQEDLWQKVVATGTCHGIAACVVHGEHRNVGDSWILAFHGKILRLTACGAVVVRYAWVKEARCGSASTERLVPWQVLTDDVGPIPAEFDVVPPCPCCGSG
jgi:prepilin-type N-terminal cleavage/methylation domain-containing protein